MSTGLCLLTQFFGKTCNFSEQMNRKLKTTCKWANRTSRQTETKT